MRRIALVVLAAVVALPLAPGRPEAAATVQRAAATEHVVSPTWGYSISWPRDRWDAERETSEDGYDLLVLRYDDDVTRVYLQGYAGYQGDAATCLDAAIAGLEEDPAVRDPALARDETFGAYVDRAPAHSYAQYLFDYVSDQGVTRWAWYGDCRTLVPGGAVLQWTYLTPADDYEGSIEAVIELERSLVLPRSAWTLEPITALNGTEGDELVSNELNATVLDVFERLEDEGGTGLPAGRHYAAVNVAVANASDRARPIDVAAISLKDQYDVQYWPTHFQWLPPVGNPDQQVQDLRPGESATMTAFFDIPDDRLIASVHCACFAGADLVDNPIFHGWSRAGAVPTESPCGDFHRSVLFDRAGRERGMVTLVGYEGNPLDDLGCASGFCG